MDAVVLMNPRCWWSVFAEGGAVIPLSLASIGFCHKNLRQGWRVQGKVWWFFHVRDHPLFSSSAFRVAVRSMRQGPPAS